MLRTLRGVDAETRASVHAQVRSQFREFAGERDSRRIEMLMADGRDSMRLLQSFLQQQTQQEHEHVHDAGCGHDHGEISAAHQASVADAADSGHEHGHVHGPGCGHEGHEHSHGGDPLPPELAEARRRALDRSSR